MEKEKYVQRWVVDISQWNPSPQQFSFLLSILPLHEHSSITRFVHFIDRKRALISRLLQYTLIHQLTSTPFDHISIKRTLEGKPYLQHTTNSSSILNFNTSHDGDYVGIASEPFHIIGLDIVSLVVPKEETAVEFVGSFSEHFTSHEWADILEGGGGDVLGQFCRYWCLKEAFVKAIGAGLGYRLNRLEFRHSDWSGIFVLIDGEESRDWEFSVSELGRSHWAGIARGHPRNAVENYRRTLRAPDFEEGGNGCWSDQFMTSFVLRTVEELLPDVFRDKYNNYADNNGHGGGDDGGVLDD